MTAFVIVPSDLTPTELACKDSFPIIIDTIIKKCVSNRKCGNIDGAIQCAKQAQELLAETHSHGVSRSIVLLLLADLYRELHQPGLALTYCQQARDALRLEPDYEHRHHLEAVTIYLQGLLHHGLGANTEALSNYQDALTALHKAIEHWNRNVVRDPSQAAKYKEEAGKCEKALRWIEALCHCLLSPAECGPEVHVPVIKEQDFELARMGMTYLLPVTAAINGRTYRMHHPGTGVAFELDDRLQPEWDARYFAVYVSANEWAGEHSKQGDYVLVEWQRNHLGPTSYAVLWDDGIQRWEFGRISYNTRTGRVWFEPYHLIGGSARGKDIEDEGIGIVHALLKPV